MLDTVRVLRKKKDKYLASMMDELEQILPPDSKEFELTRKVVLDHFNDFYRQIYKVMLGIDIEGQKYL